MSRSHDALLWFGVTFNDDATGPDYDNSEKDVVHRAINGPEDSDAYFGGEGAEWFTEHGITGVEFVRFGWSEDCQYGLAAKGTLNQAYFGDSKFVTAGMAQPEWVAQLSAALNALGLHPRAREYGWILAPYSD